MDIDEQFKQSFQDFEKAYFVFEETAKLLEGTSDLTEIVNLIDERKMLEARQAGSTQHFEKTLLMGIMQQYSILVSLSWQVMHDYLKSEGISVTSAPKEVIRYAFQNELIEDGEAWMTAVDKRNKAVHTYDNETLDDILQFSTEKFYPLVRELHLQLKEKL